MGGPKAGRGNVQHMQITLLDVLPHKDQILL